MIEPEHPLINMAAHASHAFSLIDSHLYSFTLQQMRLPFDNSTELADVARGVLEQFGMDDYPEQAEIVPEHIVQQDDARAAEFEIGLDPILDGMASMEKPAEP